MKKLKPLFILFFLIVVVLCAYNTLKIFTTNKLALDIITASELSTSGSVEAIVGVTDKKTDKSVKSKITVEMRDSKNKKVKKFKGTYEIEEGEKANFSIPLPENLEAGKYSLIFTAKEGINSDSEIVNLNISDKALATSVISLDKGIYKPGDEVNFRVLLLSKKDDTPLEKDVEISIYDGNENRVYIDRTKTSEFGIVTGKFTLANEVNSGEYKITVSTKNMKNSKTFTVNPYITPTFEVNLETAQEKYLIGNDISFNVKANYFFGEPVANATVKGFINDKEFSGLTNSEGIFEYSERIDVSGKYDVKAQVIDTSNYLIEASKTIYVGTDLFEVEVIPENNAIVKGIDNKIYFLTKNIDGTPVKTHIEISLGNITRQIVTDETGLGVLELTAQDIKMRGSEDSNDVIRISATDMNGNTVNTGYSTYITEYVGTIVSLDKVKYKQNEDITLNLKGTTDTSKKEIYICKNGELLKVISTDSDEISFNLGDIYGLIDIYAKNRLDYYNYYYNYYYDDYIPPVMPINSVAYNSNYSSNTSTYYSKKTIFISPDKALDLSITTDKEEYKPGEKLNLSFTSKNENGENADTALLVSILDEAILSLADNDLSIDNIKLALQDVELSEGVTAADLYAEILDKNAESKLRIALLKQAPTNPNIVQTRSSYYSSGDTDLYILKAVIFGALSIFIIYVFLVNRFPKFKLIMASIINLIAIFLLICLVFGEFYYYELNISEVALMVFAGIISIILYILVLYKYAVQLFNTIVNLVVLPMAIFFVALLVSNNFYNEIIAIAICLIPAILMTILVLISRKIKLNAFWNSIKNILIQCTKSEIIYVLTGIITSMLDVYSELAPIVIALILYCISEKIYNRSIKKANEKVVVEFSNSAIILAVLGLIAGMVFLYIYNSSTNSITNASGQIPIADMPMNDGFSGGNRNDALDISFDSVLSATSKAESAVQNREEVVITEEAPSVSEEIEENVRNVFLESLAFLPEIVTSNGNAKTQIDISDNITTWNIQAVGNTKDGRIGFNSANFKVFQEFFVDFSLPTNSVVTDKTNIPVTIYNYTDKELKVDLNVKENDWSMIGNYNKAINVLSNSTQMIYIPIELIKAGNNTLRIEATGNGLSDIVEKSFTISPNGFEKTKVVASGVVEKSLNLDHFTTETAIEGTRKLRVKLYPSVISQTVEGMENIFRMPTGCFEQTSSSLYPDILALKYLEDTGLNDSEIKEKALDYISKGYQKLLTYETSQRGGYSLYGNDPAENVITAFGLMEFTDLKEVYEIDENITNNMIEYLFKEQNSDGTFEIGSTYIGHASSEDDLAMNAYIIWALSEACPDDTRLEKSIRYLENEVDKTTDNYTLALMANVFENTDNSLANKVIKKLMESVEEDSEGGAYISSKIKDYWGCYGYYQNIQTTALASMALTKANSNSSTNNAFLQYIIAHKDSYGTWSTTQGTILALKAINYANSNNNIKNQKVQIKVNDDTRDIEIKDNPLDLYEILLEGIKEENKISIETKKGNLYYEITEEYYIKYDDLKTEEQKIKVEQTIDTSVKINDILHSNITVTNDTGDRIRNGLIQISIPQGCSVIEESLSKLEHSGIIEKYEYNYNKINLYFRNLDSNLSLNLDLEFRANYPGQITGAMIRVYDYYNPNNEGYTKPVNILIAE